jgi:golgin subfamily B member 1
MSHPPSSDANPDTRAAAAPSEGDALPPSAEAVDGGEISVEEAEVVDAEEATEVVEELDSDMLTAVEPTHSELAQSALDAAMAEAREALGEAGHLKLVALYEREMAALPATASIDDKARLALFQHEVGELYEATGDEGAAVKAYAKALQSDATLKPNLWAIRRVFQRRALWPNLLKLLDAEIRFAGTAAEKAELLVEKGQLLEDRLNDAAQARDCYWKATEANAGTLAAWTSLEKLYAKDGDLAGLSKVIRGMAGAVVEPGRKVALLLDLARLQDNLEGGTLDEALELCRQAAQVGFEPERALDELERLAEAAGKPEEIIRSLETRVEILQTRAREAAIADRLTLNDEIVALRRRQAMLSKQAGEGARAWDYLQSALELRPDEPLILRDLTTLGDALGRWGDLAQLYARRAENAPEAYRVPLELERASALRRAAQASDAEAVESEVLAKIPGHLGLLVARERGAMDAGDFQKLAALYVSEAELGRGTAGPTGQADVRWTAGALTAAATIHEAHLANDGEAVRLLLDALGVLPGYRPAVEALGRIYARGGKHAELAALIERELAEETQVPRKLRLYEELVGLREVRLEDPPGAAEAQRQLLALRPDDLRSRLRLIELERAAGRWAEAERELRELATRVPEERRAEVHLERADLLERRLDDIDGAAAAYKEVLALKPGEPRAVHAVEAISRKRAKASGAHSLQPVAWDDLAAALRREAEASLSPERVTAVLLKLGDVHERERGNAADAAQAYRDLLDRNPGQVAALRGLQRAVEKLGDPARQAEALEQLADAVEGEARAGTLTRLGELYEDHLHKDDQAEDAFARALTLPSPSVAHAVLGRLRVAARKKDAAQLHASLERLQSLLGEAEPSTPLAAARAALLDERATVQRWANEVDQAETLAQQAAAADPTALTPHLQLLRARAKEGSAAELSLELGELASRVADQNLKAALERRAALLTLGAGGAGALGQAAERLARAQKLGGSDAAVLVPLADLSNDPEVLALRVPLSEGTGRVEWMVERAEALEAAGRLSAAAEELARALELDAKHVWARELQRRVAKAGGDETGWARATQLLADCVLEAERAAALYHEAAASFDQLGLREEAAAAFRAVLDRTPRDGTAFRRARVLLGSLYQENHEAGPLVELLTHRLAHAEDAADRVALHLDRAEILTVEHDRDGAERDLRAVLQDQPEHLEAMRRLGQILAHLVGHRPGVREEAVKLYHRYLEGESDKHKRRQAHLELADLEEAGGHLEEAVQHLEAALETAPRASEEERLAELLVRLRQWQRAVQALRRLAALTADGTERARVEIRIASIYNDGFADPRAAVESLVRALRSEPLEMEALGRLVNMSESGHVVALEMEEQLERAVEKARGLVAGHPVDPQPYQYLTRLWSWRGDEDARVLAAQAEALVAGREPPQREGAIEPSRELSPMAWERLLPPAARTVALEIWRAAWEGALKMYGPELQQLGVGKAERQNAKGIPMAWVPLDKIARALGCGAYELYASRDPRQCALSGGALVVGPQLADRLGSRTRFRVARALMLLRERLGPVEKLDDAELTLFFAACAKIAEVPRPPVLQLGGNEAKLEERARALGKALGRKERNAVKSLGARFADLNPPFEWRRAILDGAARTALAVGGDLEGALEELGLQPKDPAALSLYVFAVSEDLIALRREMGLRT